uniref:Uncharacterized protein n=1 Tax=viral metagenome TaxID=1070528 RepID=A0A6H1ZZP6_9ZZZZ
MPLENLAQEPFRRTIARENKRDKRTKDNHSFGENIFCPIAKEIPVGVWTTYDRSGDLNICELCDKKKEEVIVRLKKAF